MGTLQLLQHCVLRVARGLCNLISGWECYDYGSSIDQLLHRLHDGTQAPLQLQVITHLALQLVGTW